MFLVPPETRLRSFGKILRYGDFNLQKSDCVVLGPNTTFPQTYPKTPIIGVLDCVSSFSRILCQIFSAK